MEKPDFGQIEKELKINSQNLQDNNRIGDSKVVFAFAQLIKVMDWTRSQLDTSNTQVGNLTDEIKDLKIKLEKYNNSANKESKAMRWLSVALWVVALFQLFIAYGQYRLGEVQIETSREQTGLQKGVWNYEQMRNDRLEARDVMWRREDLEFQKRLPSIGKEIPNVK